MRRFTVWKMMLVVALAAVALGFCIVPVGRHYEYARLIRQIDASIRYLQPTDPRVNRAEWDCAHGWTVTAITNVSTFLHYVSTAEIYRLRDDLDEMRKGKVDLETLAWIWDRLAKTGPGGKRYVEQFKPLFLDCFPPQAGTAHLLKP